MTAGQVRELMLRFDIDLQRDREQTGFPINELVWNNVVYIVNAVADWLPQAGAPEADARLKTTIEDLDAGT